MIREKDKLKLSRKLLKSLTGYPILFNQVILFTSAKIRQYFKYVKNNLFLLVAIPLITIMIIGTTAFTGTTIEMIAITGAVIGTIVGVIVGAVAFVRITTFVRIVTVISTLVAIGAIFTNELVIFYGISICLFAVISSFLIGIALSSALNNKHSLSLWITYELWYKICRSLDIDHDTMAKVVGKSAMKLFKDV